MKVPGTCKRFTGVQLLFSFQKVRVVLPATCIKRYLLHTYMYMYGGYPGTSRQFYFNYILLCMYVHSLCCTCHVCMYVYVVCMYKCHVHIHTYMCTCMWYMYSYRMVDGSTYMQYIHECTSDYWLFYLCEASCVLLLTAIRRNYELPIIDGEK